MSQSTVVGGVRIYVADAGGEPNPAVCLHGEGNTSKGLGVELYLNKGRTHIKGLYVCDVEGTRLGTFGKVPE